MPIAFECPSCKKEMRAFEHLVGRVLKCAKCEKLFTVPKVGTGTPPARWVDSVTLKPPAQPLPRKSTPAAPAAAPPPTPAAAPKPAPVKPAPAAPAPAAPAPTPAVPAPAAAFEQELVLTDDMLVDAGAAPPDTGDVLELTDDMVVGSSPAGGKGAKPEDIEFELTDDMLVEEAGKQVSAPPSPDDMALLDEIIMEEIEDQPNKPK